MSDPVVADQGAEAYANAMNEVIEDNCRMKDIYEPTRDDLLDAMVKVTLETNDVDTDGRAVSCFLHVHMYKDYESPLSPEEALKVADGQVLARPKNARKLELSFHCDSNDGLAFTHSRNQVVIRHYGWHSFGVERQYHDYLAESEPEDPMQGGPLRDNLMVRYSTTGVEFASASDELTVGPWAPDVSLPFGADALMAASTLHTPPAQAGCFDSANATIS